MTMPTKISHADRAAIFRLSWRGFLLCAFAVMTFLAWATLRQALGGELNTAAPYESRGVPARAERPSSNGAGIVNAD